MPFKKGESGNPKGRPDGSGNKTSSQLREFLGEILFENRERFQKSFEKLSDKDFAKLYLETMQFVTPKLRQTDLKEIPTLEAFLGMTPEERKERINELRKLKSDE